jgi:hypothetical protein
MPTDRMLLLLELLHISFEVLGVGLEFLDVLLW